MSASSCTRRPVRVAAGATVRMSVAALALVLLATGCGSDDDPGAAASPTAGSRDPSPSGPPEDEGEALSQGDPPKVDHVVGNVLHRPDGTTLELQLDPEWGLTAVTRDGVGDLFVTDGRWFEETVGQHRLRPDGTRRGSWGSTGPAVEAADGAVAWVDVVASEAGGSESARVHVSGASQRLTDQHVPRILGHVDGKVIYRARVRSSGNRWATHQFSTDLTSAPQRVKALPVRVMSPDGSNWYEVTEDFLSTSIGGHVDSYGLDRILVGSPPVWEDDDHLLVSYVDGDRATLARITPDGELERTLEWAEATAQTWAVAVG